MMSKFIIEPEIKEFSRCWDDLFLWNENNVYIMSNHRLALWCWLQDEKTFKREYSLIHIDKHKDARSWVGHGESECLKEAVRRFKELKEIENYNGLQCPCINLPKNNPRKTKPCITWDNFVSLAIEVNLFNHYYIYSSEGDWPKDITESSFDLYKSVNDFYNLKENIENNIGKCIVDIDLDFFDRDANFSKKISEEDLLIKVFTIIAKYKKSIPIITISINESPDDELWDKRQKQLLIIKEILKIDIPIPIMEL